jgi:formiminoglutamase
MSTKEPTNAWADGRNDGNTPADLRWHQIINKSQHAPYTFLGFCSDEGVRRNHGRTGAYGGPDALRAQMKNLPAHTISSLGDDGNICCSGNQLEEAQHQLSESVLTLLQSGTMPIVLGGGHEVAWGHYQGIRKFLKPGTRIGILNIDAHFDLRIPSDGAPTSGTSFWHMNEDCTSNGELFNYFVLGIQESGNTQRLFETARETGTIWVPAEKVGSDDSMNLLFDWINSMDHIYLTICLDAFSMSVAPGVSAPAANGIMPGNWLKELFTHLRKDNKLVSADIAELNPSLDIDNHTARLAAYLIYQLITSGLKE